MAEQTMKVRTVNGDVLTVSREHYDLGRTQLAIYTKSGRRLSDYFERMGWHGNATTLHRNNIAEILIP